MDTLLTDIVASLLCKQLNTNKMGLFLKKKKHGIAWLIANNNHCSTGTGIGTSTGFPLLSTGFPVIIHHGFPIVNHHGFSSHQNFLQKSRHICSIKIRCWGFRWKGGPPIRQKRYSPFTKTTFCGIFVSKLGAEVAAVEVGERARVDVARGEAA